MAVDFGTSSPYGRVLSPCLFFSFRSSSFLRAVLGDFSKRFSPLPRYQSRHRYAYKKKYSSNENLQSIVDDHRSRINATDARNRGDVVRPRSTRCVPLRKLARLRKEYPASYLLGKHTRSIVSWQRRFRLTLLASRSNLE